MDRGTGRDGEVCPGARYGRRLERRAGSCGWAFTDRRRAGREGEVGTQAGIVAGVAERRAGIWAADGGCAPDAGSDERAGRDFSVWRGSAEAGVCDAEVADGVSGRRGAAGDGAGQVATDTD